MADEYAPISVLFVCLGNICRSPLAEGVFRDQVERAGLEDRFEIDSAGTGNWHVGQPADKRMQATASRHGVMLTSRGRQFGHADFKDFDHILVMDRSNLHDVLFLDRTEQFTDRVKLFREFDPEPDDYQVPDPYYGGDDGFETVYAIVERTSEALLASLMAHYGLTEAG
ncbi:MAG: low molecular weight phosphotyrosine protein phosphatase [Rhodothermales bacterium]|nr:low molecular weight phosphotyrosine protein phosphatase [Rhodothermales bacterium]